MCRMGWSAGKVFPKGRRRGLGDRVNRSRRESWTHEKKAIDPEEPIQRRGVWRKKGGCGCHGRHDCHKERRRMMIILSLSKVTFPESAGDNRDIRDIRGGRSSRSSPIVTGLSWRATGAAISGRTRQSGRLSRLARLSRGQGRKPHFGRAVSSTTAVSAAPESCSCKRRRNT